MIEKHYTALIASLYVGLICVLPQIVFVISLGSAYRGIPLHQTPNEPAYLAIMHEITDGHPLVASFPYFEYKDTYPLLPPTLSFFYVAASILFNIGLVSVLLASKFVFPALLFFLSYLLIYRLEGEPEGWEGKLAAIAGGVLVTLGFDLVDYHLLQQIFQGIASPDNFLIWTRPLNPIGGALLLFSFLLCIYSLIEKRERPRGRVVLAALFLALMISSYVFSWTLSLAVLGILALFALFRRDWDEVKIFSVVGLLGSVLALPYWYIVWSASRLPDYAGASERIGLLYTHASVFNKFLLAVSLVFALSSYLARQFPLWWKFALALLLGSFIAYNQQVITGIDIWHHHFVFYTIPLGYIVLMLLLWHHLRPPFPRLFLVITSLVIAASLALGIFVQTAVYTKWAPYYREFQGNAAVIEYLNKNAPHDCVVLQNSNERLWATLVPAFTQCNLYVSREIELLIPRERLLHNYFVFLRLRGITPDTLPAYLQAHTDEVYGYLRFQIDHRTDTQFAELFARLPAEYRFFYGKDFRAELRRYKLDYILAVTPLSPPILRELGNPKPLLTRGDITLYDFSVVVSSL